MEFAVFFISFKNSILQLHMIDINAKQVREVFGFLIAVPTCDFLLAVTFYPQHRCWAVSTEWQWTGPDQIIVWYWTATVHIRPDRSFSK